MSVEIVATEKLFGEFEDSFSDTVEAVGFFLADIGDASRISLRNWRPLGADDYESRSDFHVSLKDHVRQDVIKWAWDEGASLVEVHSHGPKWEAEFSPSDIAGFEEWVPHVWWRLRARPYVAIVTAGKTFDALAWIRSPVEPEQVTHIQSGARRLAATGRTLGL
ncbi:MAG: hypothetical protein M3134_09035 [Actinomycetota bacterium]|nr:hypothetical protein [Actinomycetota bacterium]